MKWCVAALSTTTLKWIIEPMDKTTSVSAYTTKCNKNNYSM